MPDQSRPFPIASAEVLAVGAELLAGETRDTNSGDLAGELTALGVEVARLSQLPDDLAVVTAAVRDALARVDLVITTGGLGPTPDDLTRESIAAALGETPVVDPRLEAWLRDLFAQRGLPFSTVNLKQAWLIPSAASLENPNGTAPGWWVEKDGRVIVALPGPPRELRPMWRNLVLPRLQAMGLGLDRAAHTLHLTGIGESMVVDVVGKQLLEATNPRMATYARADFVDLRVSAVNDGVLDAESIVQQAVEALSPRLDAYVFARDDEDWVVALRRRLGDRDLATVEVGTGGYLALLLGEAPFLRHAEVTPSSTQGAGRLALDIRERIGASVGLAVVADEQGDDMHATIGLARGADAVEEVGRTVFRGGDAGRRRAANAALTQLWRSLA